MATMQINDLALAAYLESSGLRERELLLESTGDIVWVYEESTRLEGLIRTYQDGDALVEPLTFVRAMSRTRKRMYNHRDSVAHGT